MPLGKIFRVLDIFVDTFEACFTQRIKKPDHSDRVSIKFKCALKNAY